MIFMPAHIFITYLQVQAHLHEAAEGRDAYNRARASATQNSGKGNKCFLKKPTKRP